MKGSGWREGIEREERRKIERKGRENVCDLCVLGGFCRVREEG